MEPEAPGALGESTGMHYPYYGDAVVWMAQASELHGQLSGDLYGEEANKANVAAVCAGLAFELIFKVLVRAGGKEPHDVLHKPSRAFAMLDREAQHAVERAALKHGWSSVTTLLDYLDDDLCTPQRRYWWRPLQGGSATSRYPLQGPRTIPGLHGLHKDLCDLARQQMPTNEDWSPFSSPSSAQMSACARHAAPASTSESARVTAVVSAERDALGRGSAPSGAT